MRVRLYRLKAKLSKHIEKAASRFEPSEHEFQKVWPEIDSLEGLLVSPHQEKWLFKTARSLPNNSNIVEIGSYKGRSTCCLAFGCRGHQKRVYAIDTFKGNEVDFISKNFYPEFISNIKRLDLEQYIEPLVGLSTEIGKDWLAPIHLLFIDGSHQYDDVLADFKTYYPHVIDGGIIALHDVIGSWPGVKRAWEKCIKNKLSRIGYVKSLAFGVK